MTYWYYILFPKCQKGLIKLVELTQDLLAKFPQLKFIATRSTGYDHIDINYCSEKGIMVSNVPAYGVHTIAEHAFALMLGLSRKLLSSVERTKKGNFDLDGLQGMELYGKTLGVIGGGNIGTIVCKNCFEIWHERSRIQPTCRF